MSFLQEYTLLGELGQGGFAKVYKVRHNELGYIRAIRVLNEPVTDAQSRTYQKFLRECKVLLRLGNGTHPNIVHIYQPRLLENHALVEMDFVDGKDLIPYLDACGHFIPTNEVLRMVKEMSSALAYCHEDIYRFCMDRVEDQLQDDPNDGSKVLIDDATRRRLIEKYKVIHNDIHSGNIIRREDGSFVLLDFGLAITGADDVRNSSRHENGAMEYKAPEKWDDDTILTEQSDIYSFGIVMYEYLAGRVPFPFDSNNSNRIKAAFALGEAHREQNPPAIFDIRKAFYEEQYPDRTYTKDYPDWLEEAIVKCLEKDPAKRFRNGKELFDFFMQHLKENEQSDRLQKLLEENKALLDENTALGDKIEMLQNELHDAKTSLNAHPKNIYQEPFNSEFIKLREEINQKYDALVKLILENTRPNVTHGAKPNVTHETVNVAPAIETNTQTEKDEDSVLNVIANGISFNMIRIDGFGFNMGAKSSLFKRKGENYDQDASEDESPVHYVGLSNYYLGETLVTQSLWKAVMGNNPSFFQHDDAPVERVSWNDTQQFLKKLIKMTGLGFRLPTEAEWEFAARGGKKSSDKKYAGSDSIEYVGWFSGNSKGSTQPVKQKACNELGLYDMSGNVWEWCNDWYGNYTDDYQTNPSGPSDGKEKVLRGGSWGSDAKYCRVSKREHFVPDNRYKNYGFRLALSI